MANGLDLLVSPTNYFCVYDRAFVVVTATPSGDEGRPWNHNNNNIIPNDDEEGSSSSCSSSILHAQNEEDRRTMQWLRSVPHIPAVILFNAGLVKHRQAILLCSTTTPKTSTTSSTSSTALFHEGLTLYKMAQHCLDCNAQSGYYVAELDVLSLALANNMGHVYSHFHEWDLVKACLEKMVLLFLFANTTFLLAGEEYEFFHTTIYWAFVAILTLRGQHNNNGWMDGWMDRNLNGNTCRRLLTTLDLTYCL